MITTITATALQTAQDPDVSDEETKAGKFEEGDIIFVTSPSFIDRNKILFSQTAVKTVASQGFGYWVAGFDGVWAHKYVFGSVEEAEAAGRGFIATIIEEERRRSAARIAFFEALTLQSTAKNIW